MPPRRDPRSSSAPQPAWDSPSQAGSSPPAAARGPTRRPRRRGRGESAAPKARGRALLLLPGLLMLQWRDPQR
ncbi:MAG: hypothetical protein ACK5FE_02015, partial [Cyanobacteriota bacterium]